MDLDRVFGTFGLVMVIILACGGVYPLSAQDQQPLLRRIPDRPSGADDTAPLRLIGSDQPTRRPGGPSSINRVLAVVANSPVTLKDYKDRFGDTTLEQARLDKLIEERLIRQRAREMEILLSRRRVDAYVNNRIDSMVQQGGEQSVRRVLEARGTSLEEYRDQLRRRVRDDMLQARVMQRSFPDFGRPDTGALTTQIRARMILVGDSSTAHQIYRSLEEDPRPAIWNQLFEKHSRKLSFLGDHGSLGWFQWGHFDPSIEYHIFTLPQYGVSEPFPIRGQHAIVYRSGERTVPEPIGDANTIMQSYRQYLSRSYQERLIRRLRSRYTVQIPSSIRAQVDAR